MHLSLFNALQIEVSSKTTTKISVTSERDTPMVYKLMYITNNDTQYYISVDYNQWLKRLDTQLNELTNQNSIKVTKVVVPTNNKTVL